MRVVASFFAFLFFVSIAAADPRDYGRVVAFGDSLSDNGNLFANTGVPQAPYFNGRFSTGPTFIELLANPANSSNPDSSLNRFWGRGPIPSLPFTGPFVTGGSVNAAIGGATAGGPNAGGQPYFFSSEVFNAPPIGNIPGGIPSVEAQIAQYAIAGGKIWPNDLVSIQGGANDFFNFFGFAKQGMITLTQGDIQSFAVNVGQFETTNVAALVGLGAKTLLVSNLPSLGSTPNFNGNSTTMGAGLLATLTYNSTLNQGVQQLAVTNPGVNFIQMDWYSALNVALKNPGAFGLTNTMDACFNATAKTVCSTPNTYLFWDGVHPTETGHALLARYASLLLSTEQTGTAVGALGQIALSTRLEESDILFRRGISPFSQIPGGLYAEIIGETASFDGKNFTTYGSTNFDYSLGGVRVGFDGNYGSIAFGSSLAYQTGSLSGKALSSDLRATQIDAYALTHLSAFFAGIEGGVSLNEYNSLKRVTGFPTVTADGGTRSVDYSFAGTVGAQYHFGALTLTPAARLGYASVNIDGFTEAAPVLALQYSDRNVTTGFWTARIRAATPFFGSSRATAYGEVGYEGLFATDDSYTAKLAFNTAHAVTIGNSDLEARGFFLKAGVGGYISENIKLSGEYGLSLQDGKGDIHSGRLRLTIPLGEEPPFRD
jgi:outer membrane lipase/esterase